MWRSYGAGLARTRRGACQPFALGRGVESQRLQVERGRARVAIVAAGPLPDGGGLRGLALDRPAGWIFILDNLTTHVSESLVRYVAKECDLEEDLGVKGKREILKSVATRRKFLENKTHRIRFVYVPKHTSWLNQDDVMGRPADGDHVGSRPRASRKGRARRWIVPALLKRPTTYLSFWSTWCYFETYLSRARGTRYDFRSVIQRGLPGARQQRS